MKKVTSVNLAGNAYQMEEAGYAALEAYLQDAQAKLAHNPDRDEIISDIERAVADKLRRLLGSHKTVCTAEEVTAVLTEMGPVDLGAGESNPPPAEGTTARPPHAETGTPPADPEALRRRLFKIDEGAMIAGVCNGIAVYLNIDPTVVRVIAVILAIITVGAVAIAYVVLAFVIPSAGTAAEKAAAHGVPFTAREFIRRAQAGYYERMKGFPDRHARRAWKRQFRQDMRAWRASVHAGPGPTPHPWPGCEAPPWTGHHPGWDASAGLAVLFLIGAIWTLLCLAAAFSLIVNGTVFGWHFPAEFPLWLSLLIVFLVHQFLAWPLKAGRRDLRWGGGRSVRCGRGGHSLGDALVPFVFLGIALWLADHHVPRVHQALQDLPPTIHRGVDSLREWWARK